MTINSSINPLAGPENFPPAILTKQQAALYLQATPRFLERAIKSGRLRALKLSGKFVRIRLKDLEAFLESGSTTKEVV
jgi:excisionase family DNA binding protein